MGYGNISPRHRFVGGQETNRRINNLIFQQVSAGFEFSLWLLYSQNYKSIESHLQALLMPSWIRYLKGENKGLFQNSHQRFVLPRSGVRNFSSD
jgi:hypothetical protein